ncbi:MAG: glycosyltransferase family 2 protein [Planctomycetes bacterium]|nr:glycosyltransferase family 2 protein [Planctomycetota bacterium]
MADNPLVSIVIPALNAARTLPRAIDSIVGQRAVSWEVIVVDDGSTDDTIGSIQQHRLRLGNRMLVLKQKHAGSSVARNTGIDRARGEYVAFLDADDEFMPNKLIRQLEMFCRRPDLGLVYSDFSYNDLSGRLHRSVYEELVERDGPVRMEEIAPRLCVCDRNLLDRMVVSYLISPITAMVRRSVLGNEVRFPPGQKYSEEWLFFLDVSSRCRVGYVAEPLSVQHQTPGSLSLVSAARNTQHQVRAMQRILERYPHASKDSRRKLGGKLAHCLRQMAFDHFKEGEFRSARSAFWKALQHHADWSTAVHLAQASWAARAEALPEESSTSTAASR